MPFVLAISSFAVHGTASLKTLTSLLEEKILPVPSLLLNGLTNMSLIKKFEPPFEELLRGTFELAVNRDIELILYISYLGNASQADVILEMITTYRDHIKTIITDPVCGDHGRTYVPADVIEKWPHLIRESDLVFPNITELKILTGNQPGDDGSIDIYADQFIKMFPQPKLVITSIPGENTIGVSAHGKEPFSHHHALLAKNYGGTGDAFLGLFILNHYYKKVSFNDSLKAAAEQTYLLIKNSIEKNSNDLILAIPDII